METIPVPNKPRNAATLSQTGTAIRDRAVDALGARYRILADRARRRQLTPRERAEVDGIESTLETLQLMEGVTNPS